MHLQIKKAVAAEFSQTVAFRRYLHQHPTPSFCEEPTTAYLCEQLELAGISYRRCGANGIVARICGSRPGPCIAFRADFDALKIQEPEGLPYASQNPGVMHACGHDAHAACLLSLARLFKEHTDWIAGEVVFIFQYAEELPPGGAGPMIEDGCLDGVDRIYGFHVSDELESGTVGVCPGKYMAASDSVFIEFTGNGGHGSRPGETQDTVAAAAQAICQINTIISRFVSPLRSAVISICNIHGGICYNVIPDKVRLEGTVRTYEKETAELIAAKMEQAAKSAADMYGTKMSYEFRYGYPAVVNHERETELVCEAARFLGLPLQQIEPTPVGEDFSRYLERVPGTFFRIGIRNEELNAVYPLHNRLFALDETAMSVALEMFLNTYLLDTQQL